MSRVIILMFKYIGDRVSGDASSERLREPSPWSWDPRGSDEYCAGLRYTAGIAENRYHITCYILADN